MTTVVVVTVVFAGVLLMWPDPVRRLRSSLPSVPPAVSPGPLAGVRAAVHRIVPPRARRPGSQDADPALVLDLTAAALSAGAPPDAALDVVGSAIGGTLGSDLSRVAARLRLGSGWDAAWSGASPGLAPLRRTLALATSTGAPGAALLRDAASDLRRRRHREVEAAASRLAVRMVLPLGLCALPAFVAWAVVPVVLSLAADLLTG